MTTAFKWFGGILVFAAAEIAFYNFVDKDTGKWAMAVGAIGYAFYLVVKSIEDGNKSIHTRLDQIESRIQRMQEQISSQGGA